MKQPEIFLNPVRKTIDINHNGVEFSITILLCVEGSVAISGQTFLTKDDLADGITIYAESLTKAIEDFQSLPLIHDLVNDHSN